VKYADDVEIVRSIGANEFRSQGQVRADAHFRSARVLCDFGGWTRYDRISVLL
jgi:hypothetical protein